MIECCMMEEDLKNRCCFFQRRSENRLRPTVKIKSCFCLSLVSGSRLQQIVEMVDNGKYAGLFK